MALLRNINRGLLILLVLVTFALLYNKTRLQMLPNYSVLKIGETKMGMEDEKEMDTDIPVVICASEERIGASMATINSVYSNSRASVFFYIVTLRDAIKKIREYIEKTKLRKIRYKILEFNPMVLKGKVNPDSSRPELLHPLNFVRFYLPLLAIENHERIVYLDDDVIVQGDIKELYDIKLKPGHAAAFASDCDLPSTHEMVRSVGMQTTYMGFLDYRKEEVRELGINPSDCSFNPGVFVADVGEWKQQKITKQLEKWMAKNVRENLYSSAVAGGVATPPMLIVFHDKYTTIDPLWHVRHLGWSPDARYPRSFLKEAHLLHWNGHFKPWDYPCVHLDLWEKWFIPDPTGTFTLVRPQD
ncbi:glycosyltransferase 8 domain-containing protein 2 [Pimephales promelas]|uniref:glycosyltransferase 8 domain-containing protein 2 n=1 Tax=Pimephales promelas TaxID=90988 RepID=UPI001955CEF4|nr:glycosyltransferase 8 domain-containing protein 2 [Pimephales promelas]KAG1952843.1 glycosyltransferase 8 domain-containing protein [Pimephales promelas]